MILSCSQRPAEYVLDNRSFDQGHSPQVVNGKVEKILEKMYYTPYDTRPSERNMYILDESNKLINRAKILKDFGT
jgi:hypothetical protein